MEDLRATRQLCGGYNLRPRNLSKPLPNDHQNQPTPPQPPPKRKVRKNPKATPAKKTGGCRIMTNRPGNSSFAPSRGSAIAPIFCAICLNTQRQLLTKRLLCGHRFHLMCVSNWLKERHTCPVCRSPPDEMSRRYLSRFQVFSQNLSRWITGRALAPYVNLNRTPAHP